MNEHESGNKLNKVWGRFTRDGGSFGQNSRVCVCERERTCAHCLLLMTSEVSVWRHQSRLEVGRKSSLNVPQTRTHNSDCSRKTPSCRDERRDTCPPSYLHLFPHVAVFPFDEVGASRVKVVDQQGDGALPLQHTGDQHRIWSFSSTRDQTRSHRSQFNREQRSRIWISGPESAFQVKGPVSRRWEEPTSRNASKRPDWGGCCWGV